MSQYDAELSASEQKYGLPPGLLHGLMRTESGGNPKAVSPKGAIGLMQFMPATAKAYGIDPRDPIQSIDAAARYMAANLKTAKGDVPTALRLYQGGPDVSKHGPENAAYAGKVMGSMPGDSGDLTAMGFNAPVANDNADLSAAGFKPPPATETQKARGEVAAFIPANKAITQGTNAVIAAGVKAGRTHAQIKQDVADFYTAHNLQNTPAKNLDAAIDYHMKGGTGDIPVVQPGTYKPLSNKQTALAGLKQGVQDVDSTFVKLGGKVGIPGANGLANRMDADRHLFDTTLGNSTLANAGRLSGDIAVSALPVAGINALAARGSALALGAAPRLAPAVSFLAGDAGGNLLTRGASAAANGALQGVEGAAVTSGGNDMSLGDQLKTGAVAGAVLGPGGRLVAAGAGRVGEALAPRVNPIVAQLAQTAANHGINVRGSQISGSPFVKTVDSILAHSPGSGIAASNEGQRGAFTRAVGRTFGADTETLTPEVMQRAKDTIGGTMNDIAHRTRISVDDQFINDLASIESDAHQVVTGQEYQPLRNQLNNVLQKVQGEGDGGITGDVYQALTRKGAPLDRAMDSADPNVSFYASRIRESLDDALERSASTEDVEALRAARFAYKNMKTVEPLVAKSADGTISPAALNQRVSAKFPNRAYDGGGPLGDLADIGQRFLKDQGSSNTAERGRGYNILMNIAKVGGGAAAAAFGIKSGISPAEIGAVLGTGTVTIGAGRAAGSTLASDWYRNRLLRSALDNDQTGGVVAPWLANNFVPLTVAGANPLLVKSSNSPPVGR